MENRGHEEKTYLELCARLSAFVRCSLLKKCSGDLSNKPKSPRNSLLTTRHIKYFNKLAPETLSSQMTDLICDRPLGTVSFCLGDLSFDSLAERFILFTMFLFLLFFLSLYITSVQEPGFTLNASVSKFSFLNPHAIEFESKSENLVSNVKQRVAHSTLNPQAHIFVPFSNSNDLNTNFNITPEVFDATTPNNSMGENLVSCTFQENHRSIVQELLHFDGLILLILLIFIIVTLFIYACTFMNVEAESNDQDHDESDQPQNILQSLRLKNIDRIILGHININSIRHKIGLLGDMIHDRIDILLISETKIDKSFPNEQFRLKGFGDPYRLDRNCDGGGLLLYFRKDITAKPLKLIDSDIECIFSEVTISKKKWLLIGIYNPHKSQISSFLQSLGKNLGHYYSAYDNVIILGDFNCEMSEEVMEEFSSIYGLKSLIKKPTCFKSKINPSCIDLILTNRVNCFQNSSTVETGLSIFHPSCCNSSENHLQKEASKKSFIQRLQKILGKKSS